MPPSICLAAGSCQSYIKAEEKLFLEPFVVVVLISSFSAIFARPAERRAWDTERTQQLHQATAGRRNWRFSFCTVSRLFLINDRKGTITHNMTADEMTTTFFLLSNRRSRKTLKALTLHESNFYRTCAISSTLWSGHKTSRSSYIHGFFFFFSFTLKFPIFSSPQNLVYQGRHLRGKTTTKTNNNNNPRKCCVVTWLITLYNCPSGIATVNLCW